MPDYAGAYIRVSTEVQEREGTSLGTQEDEIRAYCRELHYAVLEDFIYREVYSGAELWERPRLRDMFLDLRDRRIQVLVVHSIDRLSRDPIHIGVIIEEAKRYGVRIEFVLESLDDSPEGELIRVVRGYAAKIERLKIMERSIRGRTARIRSGKLLPTKSPLYGYVWADDKHTRWIENPETAPILREIFEHVAGGWTLAQVGRDLTARGIPSPHGKPYWTRQTLQRMLANPAYYGEAYYNKTKWRKTRKANDVTGEVETFWSQVARPKEEWIPIPAGVIPVIVDPGIAALARKRLEENLQGVRRAPKADALLQGRFARCEYCGGAMHVKRISPHSPGYKPIHYRCPYKGRPGPNPCSGGGYITAETLDAFVWEAIKAHIQDPNFVRGRIEQAQSRVQTQSLLDSFEQRETDLRRQQEKIARRITIMDDDEAAMPLMRELVVIKNTLKELAEEKAAYAEREKDRAIEIATLEALEKRVASVREHIESATWEEKRTLLRALGIRVIVWKKHDPAHPDQIEILGDSGQMVMLIQSGTYRQRSPNKNAMGPVINLVTLPQFLLGGAFFPTDSFPAWIKPLADNMPLSYLNVALRDIASKGATLWDVRGALLGLAVWGVITYAVAIRTFKWE